MRHLQSLQSGTKLGTWKTADTVTDDRGALYLPVRTDDDADVCNDHADTNGTISDDDDDVDDSVEDCDWFEDHWFDETWCSPTKASVTTPHNDNVDANKVDSVELSRVDSLDDVRAIADDDVVDGNVEDGRFEWQAQERCVMEAR